MANDIHFLFSAQDIQSLIAKGAVHIETVSRLERAIVNNRTVAVMVVTAEGFDANNKSVGTIKGCPCPPCTTKSFDKFM
jgi:hypothetical protein